MPASTPTGWTSAGAAGEDSPGNLLGSGVLALTIDQGEHTQRYQGIVQLDGASLEEAAMTYFRQSEQIPTDVRLSVGQAGASGAGRRPRALAGRRACWRSSCPRRRSACACPTCRAATAIPSLIADPRADNSWQELLALVGDRRADRAGSTRRSAPSGCSTGCSTSTACASSRASRSRTNAPARARHPRHPRRLFGRGDRRQHRGRRDPRQLRVLLEGIRVRSGGVRAGRTGELARRPKWP